MRPSLCRAGASIIAWLALSAFVRASFVLDIDCGKRDNDSGFDVPNHRIPGSRKKYGNGQTPISGVAPEDFQRFRTYRRTLPGYNDFTYQLSGLPDGPATLVLEFVEYKQSVCDAGGGNRVFSVEVDGEMKLPDFDVFLAGGGVCRTAVVKELPVTISGGKMDVRFIRGHSGDAMISGIKVLSEQVAVDASFYLDIDCGKRDTDTGYDLPNHLIPGSRKKYGNGQTPIAGVAPDEFQRFRTYRRTLPGYDDFTYRLTELPNGPATLVLEFVEYKQSVCDAGGGDRVFSAEVDGLPILTDFDVFLAGGGVCRTAVVEQFQVDISEHEMDVKFIRGSKGEPMISGMKIISETPY